MTPTISAALSKHVYGEDPSTFRVGETVRLDEQGSGRSRSFVVRHIEDNPRTGYQGAIYEDLKTGEIIVAHRGTEFDREPLRDGALADGGMVVARINAQLPDAMALTHRAIEMARREPLADGREREVSVTGHSLGGTLAQATAYRFQLPGQTFNAYGAIGINGIPENARAEVVNHVRASDPVSAANRHVGAELRYATREDAAATSSLTAFLAVGGFAHSISNFTGPDSDLTAAARQRAEQFDSLLDHRRQQVALMRGGATLLGELHLQQREALGRVVGGGLDATGQVAEAGVRGHGRLQSQWTATVTEGGALTVRAGTELGALAQQGGARAAGGAERVRGELSAARDEALAQVAKLAEWAAPSWRGSAEALEQRAERSREESRQRSEALVQRADTNAALLRESGRELAGSIRREGQGLANLQREAADQTGAVLREGLGQAAQGVRAATARPEGPMYREPAPLPLLDDRRHPQFDLYAGALRGIEALPTPPTTAEARGNLAAALAQQADRAGLDRIDHVLASRDGQRLFAVEGRPGDPAAATASIPITAARQPVSQSTQLIEDQQALQQRAPALAPATPSMQR